MHLNIVYSTLCNMTNALTEDILKSQSKKLKLISPTAPAPSVMKVYCRLTWTFLTAHCKKNQCTK